MPARFRDAPRVRVVGNICIDLVMRGVERLPAWGQEVAATSSDVNVAGQGPNFARALARLGTDVELHGVIGDDAFAPRVRADLAAHGVNANNVASRPGATALTVAAVRPDGERAFLSDFGVARTYNSADIVLRPQPGDVCALLGQCNMPGLNPAASSGLIAAWKAAGALTIVDTGWDPANWPAATIDALRAQLGYTDCFLPNLDEAEVLVGHRDPIAAAATLRALGPAIVVVKCGSEGAVVADSDGIAHIPALPVEALDAVGAGDTFDAAFVHALIRGMTVPAAARVANAAAAWYVSRTVDRLPSVEDVVGFQ